jgi:hypothetical protein
MSPAMLLLFPTANIPSSPYPLWHPSSHLQWRNSQRIQLGTLAGLSVMFLACYVRSPLIYPLTRLTGDSRDIVWRVNSLHTCRFQHTVVHDTMESSPACIAEEVCSAPPQTLSALVQLAHTENCFEMGRVDIPVIVGIRPPQGARQNLL